MLNLLRNKFQRWSNQFESLAYKRIERLSLPNFCLIKNRNIRHSDQDKSLHWIVLNSCLIECILHHAYHLAIPLQRRERLIHTDGQTHLGHVFTYNFFKDLPQRYRFINSMKRQLLPAVDICENFLPQKFSVELFLLLFLQNGHKVFSR